eukprot:jgi/Orpsp1_1/1192592/evm.model.d7180000094479.1
MDVSKVIKSLPLLKNYGKDVDAWTREFIRVMDLWDIMEPKRRFIFLKLCIEEDIQDRIEHLKMGKNDAYYPSIKEIKIEIEKYLEITDRDKVWELKTLKINKSESITLFNINYIKKYNNISKEFQKLITVNDYINSIKSKIYPCLKVMESECRNLEEAIKIANKASKIEKELNFKIYVNKNYKFNCYNVNKERNKIYTRSNKIMCFRCYELGHKAFDCKHSFNELAIMEQQGILEFNKRRNFIHNNNKSKTITNNNNNRKIIGKNIAYNNSNYSNYKNCYKKIGNVNKYQNDVAKECYLGNYSNNNNYLNNNINNNYYKLRNNSNQYKNLNWSNNKNLNCKNNYNCNNYYNGNNNNNNQELNNNFNKKNYFDNNTNNYDRINNNYGNSENNNRGQINSNYNVNNHIKWKNNLNKNVNLTTFIPDDNKLRNDEKEKPINSRMLEYNDNKNNKQNN